MNEYDEISQFISMSDEFIYDELNNQISGQNVSPIKYNMVDIYRRKVELQRITGETDDGYSDNIEDDSNARLNQFYLHVANKLNDTCGIFLDIDSSYNEEAITATYVIWVVNLVDHMSTYLTRYILENKSVLAAQFPEDKLGDLSVKNARNTYANKVYATIMLHLNEIINILISDEETFNPDNIIKTIFNSNPEEYNIAMSKNMYDMAYLQFDIPKFQEYMVNIYSDHQNIMILSTMIFDKISPFIKEK